MKGKRTTRQRLQVLEAVRARRDHPTADQIYLDVRQEDGKISRGTVYRNLQQMASEGRLVQLDGPVARFDAVLETHTHLRCACCGQVVDGVLPYDAALDRAAMAEGWTITGHSLTFTGICPACAGK